MELMTGPQSAAQRYYFFAERAANKIPDIAKDTPIIDVQKVGVLGAGTMGGGIAMNFANVGIPVTIVENAIRSHWTAASVSCARTTSDRGPRRPSRWSSGWA